MFSNCFIFVFTTLIIYHKKYNNENFNIKTYMSDIDKDNDGIDDQTDILINAREYISTKPKYKSKYYSGGYPDDAYGFVIGCGCFLLLRMQDMI